MLLPMADALGVSVTELLESRRIDRTEPADMDKVENMVKKAINYSNEKASRGGVSLRVKFGFVLCSFFSLAVVAYLYLSGGASSFIPGAMTIVGLCIFFGIYFNFFAVDRLPNYYDDNAVSSYSDGIFRLNLAGVRINNHNWPHILKALRAWCRWAQVALVLLMLISRTWLPWLKDSPYLPAILAAFIFSLFIPVYITAKKYE